MTIEWQKEEPGWYLSDIGALMKEHDGWWFYPKGEGAHGPFDTMRAAKERAELSRQDDPSVKKEQRDAS